MQKIVRKQDLQHYYVDDLQKWQRELIQKSLTNKAILLGCVITCFDSVNLHLRIHPSAYALEWDVISVTGKYRFIIKNNLSS